MKCSYIVTVFCSLLFIGCTLSVDRDIVLMDTDCRQMCATKSISRFEKERLYEIDSSMALYFAKSLYPSKRVLSIDVDKTLGETLFYLVNFEDGWVVISSDRRTDPVLALSEEGSNAIQNSDGIGWRIMRETISAYIKQIKSEGTFDYDKAVVKMWGEVEQIVHNRKTLVRMTTPKTKGYWLEGNYYDEPYWILEPVSVEIEQIGDLTSGPFLQTKWGQNFPWNRFLPEIDEQVCPMGCVSVAISQALVFFHCFLGEPCGLHHSISFEPNFCSGSQIILSEYHPNSDRWQNMPANRYSSGLVYACDLMAEVGKAVNMQYTPVKSSANLTPEMLSVFNLSCQQGTYSFAPVIRNLNNESPVLVGGTFFLGFDQLNTPLFLGHMWAIDAKRIQTYRTRTVYRWTLVHPEDCDCIEEEIEIVDGDDYYLTYEEGLYRNPTEELFTVGYGLPYSYYHVFMNWGENGNGDNVEYSITPTSAWTYQSYEFAPQCDVSLWYDFDTL